VRLAGGRNATATAERTWASLRATAGWGIAGCATVIHLRQTCLQSGASARTF